MTTTCPWVTYVGPYLLDGLVERCTGKLPSDDLLNRLGLRLGKDAFLLKKAVEGLPPVLVVSHLGLV